jgi:hypothetical protein
MFITWVIFTTTYKNALAYYVQQCSCKFKSRRIVTWGKKFQFQCRVCWWETGLRSVFQATLLQIMNTSETMPDRFFCPKNYLRNGLAFTLKRHRSSLLVNIYTKRAVSRGPFVTSPLGINLTPRGEVVPGVNFYSLGWIFPLGVKFSVCPSVLLISKECSPLGVNEGVNIFHSGTKFTPGGKPCC